MGLEYGLIQKMDQKGKENGWMEKDIDGYQELIIWLSFHLNKRNEYIIRLIFNI